MSMTSPMMDLNGSVATDDTFQSCDSPSGSSTSEPHEDPNQLPFIDQSFFYKLDQLSPDNPLYFMQQQSQQQQQQQQLQQQQNQQMQQQQQQQQQQQLQQQIQQRQAQASTSPSVASTSSFVDPLLPSTPTQLNPTFWSGLNNNTIPNQAKNFTDYIGYPIQQQQQNTDVPGMQIRVLGVPQTGAKSRVETQIKLCIQLVTDDGDKAQWWSHLKLPEAMVAKDKLKRQVVSNSILDNSVQPNKMLYLSARVICASDPSRKVVTCLGCIQRERKRSQRRKENRTKADEDDKLDDKESLAIEEQKVLMFNCSEVVDFSSGDTILPTRITCYCRHHNERLGFCIYFEMHDHTGKQVATGISPPIMITDDHKSNKVKSGRKRLRADTDVTTPNPLLPQLSTPAPSRFNGFNVQQQQPYQIQPRPTTTAPTTATVRHQSGTESPNAFSERGSSPMQPIQQERPILQRLIPNEGPTFGGVEVTLLGSGFRQGLTCMFGDVAASSTHYWSPNTLVCILPPATDAGTVVVSFKEYPLVVDSQDVTLFTYYNENDRALMELALQVVGLKMTGKVEDAREIAMRIVQGGGNGGASSNNNGNSSDGKHTNQAALERHIIQVLQVMSAFCQVETDDISVTSPQGHTMLHLSCMLGFVELSTFLIDLGCDVNKTDRNGFTPLHYASWFNHTAVVKLMLNHGGADPEISNMWNKRPLHLTSDLDIRQMLWHHVPLDDDAYSTDNMSADVDTSFAESDTEDEEDIGESDSESVQEGWQQQEDSYLSDSSASSIEEHVYEGIRHRRRQLSRRNSNTVMGNTPISIQYLSQEDVTSHSTDDILDAEPIHEAEQLTDYEDNISPDTSKEKTWMQRTLSHFQPGANDNSSFLQNIKNTIPAKPSDLKGIADQLLQFPRPAALMVSALFPNNKTEQEEPDLAWYMALAYAMGAGSLTNEEESESSSSTSREEETVHSAKKRRDRRLYSFWVPMLCLMVIWLIYQFVSSHPGIVDSIIGISGFRRQYLTVH